MNRFPGMGRRLRQGLRAAGYWREARPDIARFCAEKGYRPQYIYAWLGDRVPSYENLIRLGRDLGALPEWVMFGTGPGARTEPVEAAAEARRAPRGQLIDFTRLRQVTSRLVRLEAELDAIFPAFPDFYFSLAAGRREPAEAAGRAVAGVLSLSRVRRAALFQPAPASGALVCVAVAGAGGDHNAWKGRVIPPGGSLSQRVIHERRPFWSHHVTAEPRRDLPAWLRERLAAEGHRSIVALPLVSRDEVLGTLTLASDSERVFTPVELRLLSGFADAAAVALPNPPLYELTERRRQAAQALADVGRLVTRSLDPDVVAHRIAARVLAPLR